MSKYGASQLRGEEELLLKPSSSSDTTAINLSGVPRQTDGEAAQYSTTPLRWLVLAAAACLNYSSAVNWVTFVAIVDYVELYYSQTGFNINLLSMVFMVASLVTGLFWAWLLDTKGLGIGLWLGVWLNLLGTIVRYVSTVSPAMGADDIAHGHFNYLMIGQCLCALANPIGLYSPAKVADVWFPQDRRALANMIVSMANPIGIATGLLLPPSVVTTKTNLTKQVAHLLLVTVSIAGFCVLLNFGIWRNKPSMPPSASADDTKNKKLPFKEGLKQLFKNRTFLLLAAMWSVSVGTFNVFVTFMQQQLCPYGYSDKFAGLCGALMNVTGLVGATIISIYVDRTKKFVHTLKICYAFALLSILGYMEAAVHPNMGVVVMVMISLFGMFAYGLLPVMVELAVECSYPVNVGVTSSVLWMCGQLLGAILVVFTQSSVFERPFSPLQQRVSTCSSKNPKDMVNGGLFTAGLGTAVACIFILLFKTPYRRLHHEKHGTTQTENGQDADLEVHY